MIPYAGAFRGFAFAYPEGWIARDNEDSVSLWKTSRGGAITISSLANEGRANALEHCRRFAEARAFDPPRTSGDEAAAHAAFTDQEGVWCKVRIVADGPRILLATYHASAEDPAEEAEADEILASLRAVSG